MCEFCRELTTGDANESIFYEKLSSSGIDILDVDVFIADNCLELYIDNVDGDEIVKRKIEIHYCPICGQKLEKETSND